MGAAMTARSPLPALVYYFMSRVRDDVKFALNGKWDVVLPKEEMMHIIEDTEYSLDGWTKGLLEVYSTKPERHESHRDDTNEDRANVDLWHLFFQVDFLHRTARDFIVESPITRNMFKGANPGLEIPGLLCHGLLAFLKHTPISLSIDPDMNRQRAIEDTFYYATLVNNISWQTHRIHPVLDQTKMAFRLDNRGTEGIHWQSDPDCLWIACCAAVEYGLFDYMEKNSHLLQGLRDLQQWHYSELLQRLLLNHRVEIRQLSVAALLATTKYLVSMGANIRAIPQAWHHVWGAFGHRLGEDEAVFELLCELVRAGADLDRPMNDMPGTYREEVDVTLPQEKAARLVALQAAYTEQQQRSQR
ncbi:hypothetical protein HJFPF1_09390 [Paramyrothecium foliicola]|nr:hypothetical protein HJFPF1_09390 [Paramyrothecium foliicola]